MMISTPLKLFTVSVTGIAKAEIYGSGFDASPVKNIC